MTTMRSVVDQMTLISLPRLEKPASLTRDSVNEDDSSAVMDHDAIDRWLFEEATESDIATIDEGHHPNDGISSTPMRGQQGKTLEHLVLVPGDLPPGRRFPGCYPRAVQRFCPICDGSSLVYQERTCVCFAVSFVGEQPLQTVQCAACHEGVGDGSGDVGKFVVLQGGYAVGMDMLTTYSCMSAFNGMTMNGFLNGLDDMGAGGEETRYEKMPVTVFSRALRWFMALESDIPVPECAACKWPPSTLICDGTYITLLHARMERDDDVVFSRWSACDMVADVPISTMRETKRDCERAREAHQEDCTKKFKARGTRSGGIFLAACPHGVIFYFHIINYCEGLKDALYMLQTTYPTPPDNLIYDYACGLRKYVAKRDPQFQRSQLPRGFLPLQGSYLPQEELFRHAQESLGT